MNAFCRTLLPCSCASALLPKADKCSAPVLAPLLFSTKICLQFVVPMFSAVCEPMTGVAFSQSAMALWTAAFVQRTRILEGGCGSCDVRFGSKADICAAQRHVRFTPDSDRESGHPQTIMSALPPKADMCTALADVC